MKTSTSVSPKQVTRRYLREFLGAMIFYVVVILLVGWQLNIHKAGPWHYALAVLPLVPIVLVFIAIVRFLARTDELIRRLHIQAFAISAGLTAFLALTWGLLEGAGLPKLSAWWTFVCIDVVWGAAFLVLRRRAMGKWFGSWSEP
ncbi:MAG: hypothetical protein ACRETQ_07755 [Gammaproteobacteria bacterium]